MFIIRRVLALIVLISSLINIFGGGYTMAIGKMIHMEVTEGEVRDAEYFQHILDDRNHGITTIPVPTSVLENMVTYMRANDFKLAPGHYKFHQGWQFKDGKFIQKGYIWDNEYDVFKFQKK